MIICHDIRPSFPVKAGKFMGKYRDHRSSRKDRFDGDREIEGSEPNYFQRAPGANTPPSAIVTSMQVASLPAVNAEVLWFNAEKGFGFARLSDGSEAFLHLSKLQPAGHNTLPAGAQLKVRIDVGHKGPQVSEVVSVSMGEPGSCVPALTPSQKIKRALEEGAQEEEGLGLVKRYDKVKGFGFIKLDEGSKDVFVHATTLTRSGLTTLDVGQIVIVRYSQGEKGVEARSVKLR